MKSFESQFQFNFHGQARLSSRSGDSFDLMQDPRTFASIIIDPCEKFYN